MILKKFVQRSVSFAEKNRLVKVGKKRDNLTHYPGGLGLKGGASASTRRTRQSNGFMATDRK
jgi:hypothetical protein